MLELNTVFKLHNLQQCVYFIVNFGIKLVNNPNVLGAALSDDVSLISNLQ